MEKGRNVETWKRCEMGVLEQGPSWSGVEAKIRKRPERGVSGSCVIADVRRVTSTRSGVEYRRRNNMHASLRIDSMAGHLTDRSGPTPSPSLLIVCTVNEPNCPPFGSSVSVSV